MEVSIHLDSIVNVLIFATLGLSILAVSFIVFDKITPGILWQEIIEKRNVALAIIVGAMTLAMAQIVASALH